MGEIHTNTEKKNLIDQLQKLFQEPLPRKKLHKCSVIELEMNLTSAKLASLNGESGQAIMTH